MKTIKTTIATTLPDQVKSKFTKEALQGMRDQINSGKIHVVDAEIKLRIGEAKKASIPEKDLVVKMKVNDDLIDKRFEWFFVPSGIPIDIKIEGEIEEINRVDLICIKMVKMPTDLSLKPVRFEMEFVEGVDYFVKRPEELTNELVEELIEKGNQVSVYYHSDMEWESIIKDTVERGLVSETEDGKVEFVFPFNPCIVSETFEEFKEKVALAWQNFSSEKKMDPLLKSIG